jgi:putative serine/threonine protein kinase
LIRKGLTRKAQTARKMTIQNLCELSEEPYASLICFPRVDKTELRKRLNELEKLKITGIEFSGKKQVLNLQVLGKGCVGIVVIARRRKRRVALKIRRSDADRENMMREAMLLRKANAVEVGPRLIGVRKDFLVMQLILGDLLPKWVEKETSRDEIGKVLKEILEQCWRLDMAGLDHGELTHAPKHIIVNAKQKPVIVDFETASLDRRPSNVTSVCQFLFMDRTTSNISEKLRLGDKKFIIVALQNYKKKKNRRNFIKVLKSCGLYDT